LATLAWIRQAEGNAAAALDAMVEAERVAPLGVTTLLNPVPAQRARLLLAQGDVATAAEWTAERGRRADDAPDYPREGWYLVLARVLLAQDRPDHSLGLLERLRGLAIAQGRTGSIAPTRPPPTCHWIIWPGYYTPSTPNQPRRAPARRSPPRPA
jgi:LuxR family maltose regulon positive regulatory protein